jgi:tetratricopeptide (TPR) repeat protein
VFGAVVLAIVFARQTSDEQGQRANAPAPLTLALKKVEPSTAPAQRKEEPSREPAANNDALEREELPAEATEAPVMEFDESVLAGQVSPIRQASALVSEGHGLRHDKRFAEAGARYREALRIFPGYPRAIAGLTLVAIDLGRGQEAVRHARTLVRMRPGLAANHRLLGDAYRVAGNLAAARRSWQLAARRGDKQAKLRLR